MAVPFVGREDELRALRALISTARRENAPAVGLVIGEPGSGKSRLLREVVVEADPLRAVLVAGFEPTERVPLAAVGDLIRLLATVPEHGPRLETLAYGAAGTLAQGALAVFEAAHRAQAALGSIVIAVDDLQWVDSQSMALLHFLVSAAESTRRPLVVIAATRPSPAAAAFEGGVGGLVPDGRRARLELRGLPLLESVRLARAIDDSLNLAEAEDLWRRAGGLPFWLEILARGRSSGDAADLVHDRLRVLSVDAGELLNALAIGARPFGRQELGAIVEWPAERLDAAARELVVRGLAINERGATRLAHDLIRETAVRGIPAALGRALHTRLAELYERTAGDDLPLLLEALEHRTAAGSPTAHLAVRVLRSPGRRLIGPDQVARLSAIANGLPSASADRMSLDAELGKLASVLGDQELALHHWQRLAENDPDPDGRQRAAWEAALAAFRLGRSVEAHTQLDAARDAAPATMETLALMDSLRAEVALWLDHDTSAGADAAGRALAAAREMLSTAGGLNRLSPAARRTYVGALEASIGAAMQEERFDDIRRMTREIVPVARALDDEAYVTALLRSGFALRPLGAVPEAEAVYREAWNLAHRAVLPYPMIDAGIGLARALRDLGRLEEARDIALETVELEARLGSPPGRWGNAVATLHDAELSIGQPGGLERLRADARSHPNPHFRMWIHQLVAAWQARLSGSRFKHDVEASLALGEADSALAGCPRCGGELAVSSVETLARIGRVDDARRVLEAWEARGIAEYPWQGILRARARASLAIAEGDGHGAVTSLARLREALEEASLLDDLVWVHLDLGAVQEATNRPAAVEAYAAAAALAERIGAAGRLRLATRGLRRLGVRAWRRGPATHVTDPLADLSLREQEVANLVATGATNVEVAEALAVSPKTIERHVTNILAKLGVRNRTELAARLRGAGTGFPR